MKLNQKYQCAYLNFGTGKADTSQSNIISLCIKAPAMMFPYLLAVDFGATLLVGSNAAKLKFVYNLLKPGHLKAQYRIF